MARTPLLRHFHASSTSYTVPSDKHFVGALVTLGTEGAIEVGANLNLNSGQIGPGVNKPLVLPGGTTVTRSGNYAGYLTGFLEDNA